MLSNLALSTRWRRDRSDCGRWLVGCASVGLLAALAGCGPGPNQFAPACPEARLAPRGADLVRYRHPDQPGQDVADLVLQGRIQRVQGECNPGKDTHTLEATVKITMELIRGPAAQGRTVHIPYFVAVGEGPGGQEILDKRVFTDPVTFPPSIDRVYLTSDPVEMQLPISPQKSGAAYTVWAGFQLTPAEMGQSSASR